MPSSPLTETQDALVAEAVQGLLAIPDEASRQIFLQQNPQLRDQNIVLNLAGQVPRLAREDADRALKLAGVASWLAEVLDDDYCRARSARATGHPLQLKGKLLEALAEYQKALDLFTKLKVENEVGITLSGSLQPLILLGNYDEARQREERARKIFKAQGDELRLARLDSNLGNVLLRQDRFEEAVVLYRRAEQSLQRFDGTNDDVALILNNLAVCYISLREFPQALESYSRLRKYSEQRHLQRLTVQADYNIAYLHYLQGDHCRAIDLYRETRIFCARAGDPYHAALCDLDQAEICLQGNLFKECTKLAEAALAQFRELGMNYEAAKAYTFLGLAACHQTDAPNALELFAKARELFLLEKNWIWPALVDFYRAIALYKTGRLSEALETVGVAQSVLSHSLLKDKAALAELLRSLLHLAMGDTASAGYWGELALRRIERDKIVEIKYLAGSVLTGVRAGQVGLYRGQLQHEKQTSVSESADTQNAAGNTSPPSKDADTASRHLISAALRLPNPAMTQKPHQTY